MKVGDVVTIQSNVGEFNPFSDSGETYIGIVIGFEQESSEQTYRTFVRWSEVPENLQWSSKGNVSPIISKYLKVIG